jgi:hypothetical protein
MTVGEEPTTQDPQKPRTTRGTRWPYAGKTNGRTRGLLMAAYGENLMAAVT